MFTHKGIITYSVISMNSTPPGIEFDHCLSFVDNLTQSDLKSAIKHYGLKATIFLQESQHSVVQLLSPRCPFQPNFLILWWWQISGVNLNVHQVSLFSPHRNNPPAFPLQMLSFVTLLVFPPVHKEN